MPSFIYEFEDLNGWTLWTAPNPPKDLVTPEINIEDTRLGAHAQSVHNGPTSLRFVKHWLTWHAGVYKQFAVTPLSLCKLSAWGRIWNVESGLFPAPSNTNTHPYLRVGIDGSGGTDPASESVTWNELKVYDEWKKCAVQTSALAGTVTIFAGFENGRSGMWDLAKMYAFLDSVEFVIEPPVIPPDPDPHPAIVGGVLTESVTDMGDYFKVVQRWAKVRP
ncbi:hypothetical protein [Caudoviricetes sp.]|nr:hypothetical protein [Caudoviricetes sp.]UOF81129.1 hypothetical protein [Caudoviricetes sp.]UOF82235.1 hypothetical protein [Caudoviricetes sp.]UOF82474.1 hypothetical protein [Caudoviricetes sp.]UOF82628.1 hypothetical protein [Caudoviricetes sp.]